MLVCDKISRERIGKDHDRIRSWNISIRIGACPQCLGRSRINGITVVHGRNHDSSLDSLDAAPGTATRKRGDDTRLLSISTQQIGVPGVLAAGRPSLARVTGYACWFSSISVYLAKKSCAWL